jgi:transposase
MWSDECSAERGKAQKQCWVLGIPSQKWMPKNVQAYKKGKQLRVMVWACFWGNSQKTPLYIIDRDFESKKQGYSAASYISGLEDNLPFYNQDGLIFMQDNAPIHTATKVREWFIENGIRITDWPPYSSDMNPIEHAWKALKEKVCEMYPDLWNGNRQSEADLQALEEALCKA